MLCEICKTRLKGRQKRFCKRKCANQDVNRKHKVYDLQQKRAIRRKTELVRLAGGKCIKCGYNKSLGALSFHHKEPSQKSFGLDARHCSNNSWETLLKEAAKCILLCLNCHAERHWYL